MKKFTLMLIMLIMEYNVYAADFVNHHNNKPQNPKTIHANIQIINFWASWCQPCRKEMPDMSHWYQTQGKKQKIFMVGIAIDTPQNVQEFLKTTPVTYPIWRYTGKDSRAMMIAYGNKIGALPYTTVRAPKCQFEESIVGEITNASLNQAVQNANNACKNK